METIGIADLKSHLSAELKKVAAGETLLVLDHRKPVALVVPLPESLPMAKKASRPYRCLPLDALTLRDPLEHLAEERSERW